MGNHYSSARYRGCCLQVRQANKRAAKEMGIGLLVPAMTSPAWSGRCGGTWLSGRCGRLQSAPMDGTKVLCWSRDSGCFIARFDGTYWLVGIGAIVEPTHWMPLPDGPGRDDDGTTTNKVRARERFPNGPNGSQAIAPRIFPWQTGHGFELRIKSHRQVPELDLSPTARWVFVVAAQPIARWEVGVIFAPYPRHGLSGPASVNPASACYYAYTGPRLPAGRG